VSQAAQEALQRAGLGRYGGRVSVAVSAVLAVPKSYTRAQRVDAVNGYSYPSGDLDNYAKVMDGLNRIVWEDDRQIVQMSAIKRWARQGEQEGLTIEVVHLDDQP
jgi:Holliday junction resolvase RusA-like endonuclease